MDIKTLIDCLKTFKDQRVSILLRGKHGIGKSQIVKQFAESVGMRCIDRRLSQMSEGDMIGLPKLEDGVTRFYPAEFIMQACDGPVVLFLDELNRAAPEVIQSAFQLVLDRELNGNTLHPDTLVFAAINATHEYQVNEMDPALVDRFWVVDLQPTMEDWVAWAESSGKVHPDIIAFVKRDPDNLEAVSSAEAGKVTPSRRSWERLSKVLVDAELIDDPDDPRFWSICTGFVGIEVANQFVNYCKTLERDVTVEQVLTDIRKHEARIRKLSMDNLNGLCDRIAKWSIDNVFEPEQARQFGGFFRMLPPEMRMNLWAEIVKPRGDEPKNAIAIHRHIVTPLLEVYDAVPDPSIPAKDVIELVAITAPPKEEKVQPSDDDKTVEEASEEPLDTSGQTKVVAKKPRARRRSTKTKK